MPATPNPKRMGTKTPRSVITNAETPVAFICFKSVSIPAENIMRITPISAIKFIPSIAVLLNIG